MLTRQQFEAWLQARRSAGETLTAIGEKLGVSHVTVSHWISGRRNPSRMALSLAGEICRAPVEMAAGLPSPREPCTGARTHLEGGRSAMVRLAVIVAFLLCALGARAQGTAAIQDHCTLGGTQAFLSGLLSTNYQQGIIPSCTVTVYLTGTQTRATIFADASGTTLANPFTANTNSSSDAGGWIFWAAVNQGYDIVLSGGIPPNTYGSHPVTLTDRYPGFSFSGGTSATPCGNRGQIQIADTAGNALDCDPNFLINSHTHTRTSTGNDELNAVSIIPRNTVDPLDAKFAGGLAAAISGTSGHTPTQVLNAALDYGWCQTKLAGAAGGWILVPPLTMVVDGVKMWPNERLGGESFAALPQIEHGGNSAPMIGVHGSADTVTCSNGTTYTPGASVGDEVAFIAISGAFTGSNDIGIDMDSISSYVHDVVGFDNGFGQQAILLSGQSAYAARLGVPSGQLKGCQDYINGVSTGTCSSVELDNLDGNAEYIYATDGADDLSGFGPGPCYPNCSAIGVYGPGSTADNLFAQLSDIGIIDGGINVRANNWRVDATSMEGVRFTTAAASSFVFDVKTDAPCMSTSLQSNYNAGTATGCFAIHNVNVSGGGLSVLGIQGGGDAFFGNSYIQGLVGDGANSGAGNPSTYGLAESGEGNPGNTTNNDWIFIGGNQFGSSPRWLFPNAGTPINASTSTINVSGLTSLYLANGLTVTNFTGFVAGQTVTMWAAPEATSATLATTGNFISCNGLPVTVTTTNPVVAISEQFAGKMEMVCNPPNLTPSLINYSGNTTPTNPSLIDVFGNIQTRPQKSFTQTGAVQLHGATAPSGHACFVQQWLYPDGSQVISEEDCTTVDLSAQTPGEVFVVFPGSFPANLVTVNLWMTQNTEPNGIATGLFPAHGTLGTPDWDGPTTIAAGGNGAAAPVPSDNNTGESWGRGSKQICPNPLPTCTAEYQSLICAVPGSGSTADVWQRCNYNGSTFAWTNF